MQGWIKRVILSGLLTMAVGGCATIGMADGVDVSVRGANYTDDYINFTIYSISGKNLGIGGRASSFEKGGGGGGICCGVIPKPGGMIKIEWKVGDNAEFHTKDVLILGSVIENARQHSYLIVRFFSEHEVEAEVIPYALMEPSNPRSDKLFLGRKIMRHKGA